MTGPFVEGTSEHLPKAKVTFDRYHVRAHLAKAVDEVRREEATHHTQLLKNIRYMWPGRPQNLTEHQRRSARRATRPAA